LKAFFFFTVTAGIWQFHLQAYGTFYFNFLSTDINKKEKRNSGSTRFKDVCLHDIDATRLSQQFDVGNRRN